MGIESGLAFQPSQSNIGEWTWVRILQEMMWIHQIDSIDQGIIRFV